MSKRLVEKLQIQGTKLGLWVTVRTPDVTEIAADLNFDWICVDMEHGPLGFQDVADHLRAAAGTGLATIVRVPQSTESYVKRALDLDADAVIVPYVETADDVEQAVRFGSYPPRGVRGIGGARAFRWGSRTDAYIASANDNTAVVPLIETREAFDAIDPILGVDGVRALFVGPADLSASFGYPGAWDPPPVARAIDAIREQAHARGVAVGIMARSADDARRRIAEGFDMLALGSDMGLFRDSLRRMIDATRG